MHFCQGRVGAVGVLELVDANGDLIPAGLKDDRQNAGTNIIAQ